jgi:hypothetical protein
MRTVEKVITMQAATQSAHNVYIKKYGREISIPLTSREGAADGKGVSALMQSNVGLLHEAQYGGVKPKGFALVVEHHAGPLDLHTFLVDTLFNFSPG